jgi:hypothetical protein
MSPTPKRDPNAPPDPNELREIPDHQHAPPSWSGHTHNPVPPHDAASAGVPPWEPPPIDQPPAEPPPEVTHHATAPSQKHDAPKHKK